MAVEATDLIDVERESPDLDLRAGIERKPFDIVASHVDAVGIVVSEMQHDRNRTLIENPREPLSGL